MARDRWPAAGRSRSPEGVDITAASLRDDSVWGVSGSCLVGTPRVGLRPRSTGGTYRLGYSLGALGGEGTQFELGVDAQRREKPDAGRRIQRGGRAGHGGLVDRPGARRADHRRERDVHRPRESRPVWSSRQPATTSGTRTRRFPARPTSSVRTTSSRSRPETSPAGSARSTPRSPKPTRPRPRPSRPRPAPADWFSRSSACINAEGRVAQASLRVQNLTLGTRRRNARPPRRRLPAPPRTRRAGRA